ncbi:hypothetical protein TNCV_4853541 [Trichonephila clavipes]|nr:hypothetical protein TNCV_4853541 [Trichonephila clavipes]
MYYFDPKKPRALRNLSNCGSYSEARESRSCYLLSYNHPTSLLRNITPLAWMLTRPDRSVVMPGGIVSTCSNAPDSMNTLLTTSLVGPRRLGVKWSRSQACEMDK